MDRRSIFIVVWIALQVAFPLSYYVGQQTRYDAYDERWAWRMFSPIRMVRCQSEFRVGGDAAPLGSIYHATWSTLAARGRPDVLRAIGDDLCRRNPGQGVTLTLVCREADGTRVQLEDGADDLCQGGGGFR